MRLRKCVDQTLYKSGRAIKCLAANAASYFGDIVKNHSAEDGSEAEMDELTRLVSTYLDRGPANKKVEQTTYVIRMLLKAVLSDEECESIIHRKRGYDMRIRIAEEIECQLTALGANNPSSACGTLIYPNLSKKYNPIAND